MVKPVILCIHDEPTVLATRKLVLESAGFRVLTAHDGREGLQQFVAHDIGAVVLDYFLPLVDGGAVAAQMKRLKPQVPIMMVSAQAALPAGALDNVDAFVSKGSGPEAMLTTLETLLKDDNQKAG